MWKTIQQNLDILNISLLLRILNYDEVCFSFLCCMYSVYTIFSKIFDWIFFLKKEICDSKLDEVGVLGKPFFEMSS